MQTKQIEGMFLNTTQDKALEAHLALAGQAR